MKRKEIENFLNEHNLEENKYVHFKKIKSIKLKTGREIIPDWLHLRMCFSEKGIKLQYGSSIPFGGRLIDIVQFSADLKSIIIKESATIKTLDGDFRFPKIGDKVRSSLSNKITLSEAFIVNIIRNCNGLIHLNLSQQISNEGRLSIYDPMDRTDYDSTGDVVEGIYMRFIPNRESISKKETIHEIIKYQDITEISVNI